VSASVLLAWAHLLALAIGFGAVLERSRALRGPLDPAGLARAFRADNLWALAAGLWLATGLWRLFAESDKPIEYYLRNHWFFAKMGAFLLVFALEAWPIATLIRWRSALRRGETPELGAATTIARIGHVQAGLLVLMVLCATAMARGFGFLHS
jgi:putative membrane protein